MTPCSDVEAGVRRVRARTEWHARREAPADQLRGGRHPRSWRRDRVCGLFDTARLDAGQRLLVRTRWGSRNLRHRPRQGLARAASADRWPHPPCLLRLASHTLRSLGMGMRTESHVKRYRYADGSAKSDAKTDAGCSEAAPAAAATGAKPPHPSAGADERGWTPAIARRAGPQRRVGPPPRRGCPLRRHASWHRPSPAEPSVGDHPPRCGAGRRRVRLRGSGRRG